jgi:hypothetical protein
LRVRIRVRLLASLFKNSHRLTLRLGDTVQVDSGGPNRLDSSVWMPCGSCPLMVKLGIWLDTIQVSLTFHNRFAMP